MTVYNRNKRLCVLNNIKMAPAWDNIERISGYFSSKNSANWALHKINSWSSIIKLVVIFMPMNRVHKEI